MNPRASEFVPGSPAGRGATPPAPPVSSCEGALAGPGDLGASLPTSAGQSSYVVQATTSAVPLAPAGQAVSAGQWPGVRSERERKALKGLGGRLSYGAAVQRVSAFRQTLVQNENDLFEYLKDQPRVLDRLLASDHGFTQRFLRQNVHRLNVTADLHEMIDRKPEFLIRHVKSRPAVLDTLLDYNQLALQQYLEKTPAVVEGLFTSDHDFVGKCLKHWPRLIEDYIKQHTEFLPKFLFTYPAYIVEYIGRNGYPDGLALPLNESELISTFPLPPGRNGTPLPDVVNPRDLVLESIEPDDSADFFRLLSQTTRRQDEIRDSLSPATERNDDLGQNSTAHRSEHHRQVPKQQPPASGSTRQTRTTEKGQPAGHSRNRAAGQPRASARIVRTELVPSNSSKSMLMRKVIVEEDEDDDEESDEEEDGDYADRDQDDQSDAAGGKQDDDEEEEDDSDFEDDSSPKDDDEDDETYLDEPKATRKPKARLGTKQASTVASGNQSFPRQTSIASTRKPLTNTAHPPGGSTQPGPSVAQHLTAPPESSVTLVQPDAEHVDRILTMPGRLTSSSGLRSESLLRYPAPSRLLRASREQNPHPTAAWA